MTDDLKVDGTVLQRRKVPENFCSDLRFTWHHWLNPMRWSRWVVLSFTNMYLLLIPPQRVLSGELANGSIIMISFNYNSGSSVILRVLADIQVKWVFKGGGILSQSLFYFYFSLKGLPF